MTWTRRGAIGVGLAVGFAPGLPAWGQANDGAGKIVVGKSGHVFAQITLAGQPCYALLDNTQLTAISFDAPNFNGMRKREAEANDKGDMYVRFRTPMSYKVGNAEIQFDIAMRGLSNYSDTNGVHVAMLLGSTVFETCVVELDFKAGAVVFHSAGEFPAPQDAKAFPADGNGTRGRVQIPVQIGPDVSGMADVSLGFPSVIRISHPKVGEWLNDGRPVVSQGTTTVLGSVSVRGEQVAFQAPPLKVGPFDFGRVRALADPEQRKDSIATLGVAALRPFKVWIDQSHGRIWLKVNTA